MELVTCRDGYPKARKAPASRRSRPAHIYQLLISLDEVEPKIWRRLWVPDTLTLAKLDRVIQAALGWTSSHLHEFAIEGRRYGIVDPEWDQEPDLLEDKRFRVGDVLGTDVQEFVYAYDFGDGWMHSVKVEQILVANEDINTWPLCLAGANACPPKDVGGTHGYMEFLQAIRDPVHNEHDQCGGGGEARLTRTGHVFTSSCCYGTYVSGPVIPY